MLLLTINLDYYSKIYDYCIITKYIYIPFQNLPLLLYEAICK